MMENNFIKKIHFFDLDGTLWETNAKAWIIDKRNPSTYITKIDAHTFNLFSKGYYINDNKKINYNGLEFWLSNELFTEIRKKKAIELENIGLSIREFNNIDLIKQQKNSLTFYTNRLKKLSNIKEIILLTARGNKIAHSTLLDELSKKLIQECEIKIINSIFVNDTSELVNNNIGDTATKKLIKLIESLVGYKIENNKFQPIMISNQGDEIYFYDDEDKNIELCKEINTYILDYYNNSSSVMKERINNIDFTNKKLITNLVTSNEVNPFIKDEIIINKISG